MAPRRKLKQPNEADARGLVEKRPKIGAEKMICKNTSRAIDQRETMATSDRFTSDEKKKLLEAYNKCGFQAFQNMKLLQEYIPGRTENDLKGLISRLKSSIDSSESRDDDHLDDWQRLCFNLMGIYSRTKQANVNEVLSDALQRAAEELDLDKRYHCDDDRQPNYPKLLNSFSQLLMGRFPDNMTPANARISMRMFDHVNAVTKSIDIERLTSEMGDGRWLDEATSSSRSQQEMALKGLDELDKTLKSGLTVKDLENKNLQALCAELPKIKLMREVLDPLNVSGSNYI